RRVGNARVALPHRSRQRRPERAFAAAPALLERARERVDVARRAEEAGVARDAAHRVRVLVADLAAEDALPPRAALGGGDPVAARRDAAGAHLRQVDGRELTEAERSEEARAAEAVEGLAADRLDRLAEQHEAEVAVDRAGAGRRLELLAVDLLVDPLL